MKLYLIFLFFSIVINFFLWTYIFALKKDNRNGKCYLIFVANLIIWQIVDFLAIFLFQKDLLTTSFFKIKVYFWMMSSYLFLNFVFSYINKKYNLIYYFFGISIISSFIVNMFTNLFVKGFVNYGWIVQSIPGIVYAPYFAINTFCAGFYGLYILYKEYIKTEIIEYKKHLTRLFTSLIIGYSLLVVFNLIIPRVFKINDIPRMGSSLLTIISIYLFIVIIKYDMLSIGFSKVGYELFSSVHESIILFDNNGKVIKYNNQANDIFSITDDKEFYFKDIFNKDFDFKNDYIKKHYKFIDKNGNLKFTYFSLNSLYSQKIFIGKIAIVSDITNLKEYEIELKIAKDDAEKANKLKSEFLAKVSHELRTPLNAVIGFSEISMERKDLKFKDDISMKILNQSQKLLHLINQLLDFSKIEFDKMELEKYEFNLINLISDISYRFRMLAKKKKINFIVNIDKNIPNYLVSDELKLNQIITNLLDNAVKFTKKGRVELNVNVANKSENRVEIEFQVKDTGIGIEKDSIDTIFESFKQSDNSITRRFGGTGLGVTISKQLTELFNGTINVTSEKNIGTDFTVKIEFEYIDVKSKSKDKYVKIFKNHNILENMKILAVEDNSVNLEILIYHLNNVKIDVDIANNGLVAIEKFKKNRYDMILMDLHMPKMNGIDATKEIRKIDKSIPILGITANAYKEDIINCIDSGMNDVILKPFKKIEIYNKIIEHKFENFIESRSIKEDNLIIDIESLKSELGLDLSKEIINGFIKQTNSYNEKLEILINDENYSEVLMVLHSIKGGSANIFANRLFFIVKNLYEKIKFKEKNIDYKKEIESYYCAFNEFVDEYNRIFKEV